MKTRMKVRKWFATCGRRGSNVEKNAALSRKGHKQKSEDERTSRRNAEGEGVDFISEQPGFFDNYPRFRETSTTASNVQRLNFRYRHTIERNRSLLEGKRVLDIASHDGRFVMAALAGAGASHVTGIEARESLVASATESLAHYGIAGDRFDLIVGDVFEKIQELREGTIDTAMVLGFLYHTARQYELISAIARLGTKAIIIDSQVLKKVKRPVIRLKWESTLGDGMIWDENRRKILSSTPSAPALKMILEEFGYEVEVLKTQNEIPRSALQYKKGKRITMVGRRDSVAQIN